MPRLLRRLAPVLAAALGAAALGCGDDAQSPTSPQEPSAPALATTAPQALSFSQVSAGEDHTCGVTTDHRAYCWGWNGYGQLGDGTGGALVQRLAPVAVAGGLSFRQVSAGYIHSCGVTTDFRAYCWGNNSYGGQLGDGTTTDRVEPVRVAGGHQFRRVEAGYLHTCGVSYPDGQVYCWGSNSQGQLGDGTITLRLTPVAVLGGRQFRQVSTGWSHTCGVTTDDRAYCWGWNRYGQIGDSTEVGRRTRPVLVAGGHQFRQLDAGLYHNCAVTTDDRAFCWGYGRLGQIGNGKTYLSFWPRAVAGGLSFRQVSAGGVQTCGVTTGGLAYCWGNNTFGTLGDGTTETRLRPVAVAGGLIFQNVSAGGSHTCAWSPTAVAYCWGFNGFGQIGDGTTTSRLTPVLVVGPT